MQDVAFLERLILPERDTEWIERGACRGIDPDVFYPDRPTSISRSEAIQYAQKVQAAKDICGRCPVRAACRKDAMDRHEVWGIWGGIDFNLPKRERSKRKVA